ncbi:hypothetical protein TNCV_28501 [Trichonephila clavipes]|uniref:Uncharacterized protein n=1 Tax=Trichonephila clavipes TaxID=2585209 RepID=A0A8X7BLP8_TRICX|nr:hypothetical protein TNCV_28501 [Trichonephila clavipes]
MVDGLQTFDVLPSSTGDSSTHRGRTADLLMCCPAGAPNFLRNSNDENKMNNATPVPMSSEMKSIMESIRGYLDEYCNDEMISKMGDMKQFIRN